MISIFLILFMVIIGAVNFKKYGEQVDELPKKLLYISKISAVICMAVGLTMAADLMMPKETVTAKVSKYANTKTVDFGIYSEEMNETAYNCLKNNDTVLLSVSRIYDEIKKITLLNDNNKVLNFPTVDDYMFILLTIMYFIPVVLFFKKNYTSINAKGVYFLVNIMSPILGVTGSLIIIKLFLVHIAHIFPRM